MKVTIEGKRILIGERALEYYPYYFAIWDDEVDHRLTVKKVLAQWAMALTRLESTSEPVWLPYYLDDQDCKFLKAELDGEHVVLTDIYVWADGYAMDLDDLSTEMRTEPDAVESFSTLMVTGSTLRQRLSDDLKFGN
jgi:hypothetical protein